MKAIIRPQASPHNGPLLTIGMIVKNEEKTLNKCLSALIPLIRATNGELIITDTGSTDRTVEIAKKYTDTVNYFKWCNDFSAARNYNLSFAKGKWFMFVDADEIFDESVLEIARFLISKDSENYTSANYIQRNYGSYARTEYMDFRPTRVFRMAPNIKFVGKIHEGIPVDSAHYSIAAVAHHDGYIVLNTGFFANKKSARNAPLLREEIKKSPNDSRLYSMLCDCYCDGISEEREEIIQILEDILHSNFPKEEKIYVCTLYSNLFASLLSKNDFFLVQKYYDRYLQYIGNEYHYSSLDVYYDLAHSYITLHRLDEAKLLCDRFLDCFAACENGLVSTRELSMSTANRYNERFRIHIYICLANICIKTKQLEKAREYVEKALVNAKGQSAIKLIISNMLEIMFVLDDFSYIARLYQLAQQDEIKIIKQGIDVFFAIYPHKRNALVQAVASLPITDNFVALNYLRAAQLDISLCDKKAIEILQHTENIYTDSTYADVFLASLVQPDAVFDYLNNSSLSNIKVCLGILQNTTPSLNRIVYNFIIKNAYSPKTLREYCVATELAYHAVNNKNDLTFAEMEELFDWFVRTGRTYIDMAYNQQIINDADIYTLPKEYVYIYFAHKAQTARQKKDNLGYLKNLRFALKSNEAVLEATNYLLTKFKMYMDAQADVSQELQELSIQVKGQIRGFIANGQKKEADEILQRYMQINPNDSDIVELTEKL